MIIGNTITVKVNLPNTLFLWCKGMFKGVGMWCCVCYKVMEHCTYLVCNVVERLIIKVRKRVWNTVTAMWCVLRYNPYTGYMSTREGVEYSKPGPVGSHSPLYIDCPPPAKASRQRPSRSRKSKMHENSSKGGFFSGGRDMQTRLHPFQKKNSLDTSVLSEYWLIANRLLEG